jgi:hypothetical protein
MVSNDAIHVQAEEGKEDDNVKGISTLEAYDYLCAMHDV